MNKNPKEPELRLTEEQKKALSAAFEDIATEATKDLNPLEKYVVLQGMRIVYEDIQELPSYLKTIIFMAMGKYAQFLHEYSKQERLKQSDTPIHMM